MSDTINIPVELYDDLVKIVNRLQACNRSVETSQKEGVDNPPPPSKETIIYNKFKKQYENH